jgi:hypothetical protein
MALRARDRGQSQSIVCHRHRDVSEGRVHDIVVEDMKPGMADFIKLLSASRTLRREMGQKCVLCLHNNRSLDVFFWGRAAIHAY